MLDSLLRRSYGIREFSLDPDCVLRLSVTRAGRDRVLPGGVGIVRGDLIGDIHLWNERLPPIPQRGPDVAWGLALAKRLRRSLEELADVVATDPRYRTLKAIRGTGSAMLAAGQGPGRSALPALARRLEFQLVPVDQDASLFRRFTEFWENLYSLALMWAYNAPSLRTKRLAGLRRVELWMSTKTLLGRYNRAQPHLKPVLPRPEEG